MFTTFGPPHKAYLSSCLKAELWPPGLVLGTLGSRELNFCFLPRRGGPLPGPLDHVSGIFAFSPVVAAPFRDPWITWAESLISPPSWQPPSQKWPWCPLALFRPPVQRPLPIPQQAPALERLHSDPDAQSRGEPFLGSLRPRPITVGAFDLGLDLWFLSPTGQTSCRRGTLWQARGPCAGAWVSSSNSHFVPELPPCFTSRGFPGGSGSKESACSARDMGFILGLGRPPGGGHGNPLQYSCLGNPYGQKTPVG